MEKLAIKNFKSQSFFQFTISHSTSTWYLPIPKNRNQKSLFNLPKKQEKCFSSQIDTIGLYLKFLRSNLWKGKGRNSDGWVTLLHAGHDLGLKCLIRFFGNIIANSFTLNSQTAYVHYASASFRTTPPTYLTLPYPGFETPPPFGFHVGNATIEVGWAGRKLTDSLMGSQILWPCTINY
jgi:hypothetical protein